MGRGILDQRKARTLGMPPREAPTRTITLGRWGPAEYRDDEIARLRGLPALEVEVVHALKVELDAVLLTSDEVRALERRTSPGTGEEQGHGHGVAAGADTGRMPVLDQEVLFEPPAAPAGPSAEAQAGRRRRR